MKYIIVSYKSRNNLISFAKLVNRNGIPTQIINTPRSVAISCGLSIKTEYKYFNQIIKYIHSSNFSGFLGVYLVNKTIAFEQIDKLY